MPVRPTILVFILLLFTRLTFGQGVPPATVQQSSLWFQALTTLRVDEHWSIPIEIQVRRAKIGRTWQQAQVRTGLARDLNAHFTFGAGYSFSHGWPYGKQPAVTPTYEHRIYEQLVGKHLAGRIPIEHRVRFEQRWLERIDPESGHQLGDLIYTNRIRYKAGLNLPLTQVNPSRKDIGPGDTFLFITEEAMANFGKNVQRNTFDQNRFATGIGHNFSRGSIQVGYLHQYLQKADGVRHESNHNITVGLTYNISLR
ncbi:MAG: DUF2490 domain-containing protein [Acidobacteriota bacterium]